LRERCEKPGTGRGPSHPLGTSPNAVSLTSCSGTLTLSPWNRGRALSRGQDGKDTEEANMRDDLIERVAGELHLKADQVRSVSDLFGEGATVPFIARYRKEATGSLDEVAITEIRDRLARLEELDRRREAILKSLEERELLTDKLKSELAAAETLATLEDIYLPFRPKKRTRAILAREKGLEPLAERLRSQEAFSPEEEARLFVDPQKGVNSVEEALAGARDIVAEWVNEDAAVRARMRELFEKSGLLSSRVLEGKEAEGQKYRDYFDWQESIASAPSHRILAIRRGEKEKVLLFRVQPSEEEALAILEGAFLKARNAAAEQVKLALKDAYKRLLGPSLETEIRLAAKIRADTEAIRVFADNLRQLLLDPPLGSKTLLALDPGYRTGCKVVCLDRQGKLLHHDVVYPHSGPGKEKEAARTVEELCARFGVEAVAVGNGTAGRETEAFLRGLRLPGSPPVFLVNESGASVYSASEAAREEFPDQDITVRGAVSIGRRLQDPLAELVKIDPKSIGVGQYQHDVNPTQLKQSLDDVVSSCVNAVGVEVNTASRQLLTYVSGLGPQLAHKIVEHRNGNGPFRARQDLLKVPRLGPRAFEQAAGFLRIRDGDDPLDASAVHPESYPVVHAMAEDLGCRVIDLMRQPELRGRIRPEKYVSERVGLPTLQDIMAELARPGRDPREGFESFRFDETVSKIEDLTPGRKLPGKVTNITRFGVFVDVGVHQDGLVHISQMADRFVKDPAEVVKLGQNVTVTVLEVDPARKRIALSLRDQAAEKPAGKPPSREARAGERVKPKGSSARTAPPARQTKEKKKKKEELDANNPFVKAFRDAKLIP